MPATILRTAAIIACLFLVTSFSLFAIDQAGGASQQAQAEVSASGAQVVGPAIGPVGPETGARGTIDDVNRALVSPVQSLAPGQVNSWGARLFELAAGILLYGVVLGMIARSLGLARRHAATAAAGQRPHF